MLEFTGSVKNSINSQENETDALPLEGNTMSDEENESKLPEDVLDLAYALRNGNEEMENLEEDEKIEENEEGIDKAEENETTNETIHNGTRMEENSKKAATLFEDDSIVSERKSISDRKSPLGDIESLTDDTTSYVEDAEETIGRRTENRQKGEGFQEEETCENRVPNVKANEMYDVEYQHHISSLNRSKEIKILPDGINFSDVM